MNTTVRTLYTVCAGDEEGRPLRNKILGASFNKEVAEGIAEEESAEAASIVERSVIEANGDILFVQHPVAMNPQLILDEDYLIERACDKLTEKEMQLLGIDPKTKRPLTYRSKQSW